MTPEAGYISPEAMVAGLAVVTGLETLRIEVQSPGYRLLQDIHLSLPRRVLPALTEFRFRGVSEYLEDFGSPNQHLSTYTSK